MATTEFVQEEIEAKVQQMLWEYERNPNAGPGEIFHPSAVLYTGPPATGKSAIPKAIAKKYGLNFMARQTPMYLPEEIKGYGIPRQSEKYNGSWVTESTVPIDFMPPKGAGPTMLNLDDFNTGPKAAQAFLYRLIHEHAIGGHEFQVPVMITLTGNGINDKAIASALASTMITRCQYIPNVKPSFEHWSKWALNHGIHEGIIAYFRDNPQKLYEPPQDDRSTCTPRTIELMNRDLKWRMERGLSWDKVMTPERMSTYVGDQVANELAEYGRYENVFGLIQAILDKKIEANSKKLAELEDDSKYVLAIGVASRAELPFGYDFLLRWSKAKGNKEIGYYATRFMGKARDEGGKVMEKFSDQLMEAFGTEFKIEVGILRQGQ